MDGMLGCLSFVCIKFDRTIYLLLFIRTDSPSPGPVSDKLRFRIRRQRPKLMHGAKCTTFLGIFVSHLAGHPDTLF